MNEEIRCPHCKGNKLQELGNGEYKCMYCGGKFKYVPAPKAEIASDSTTRNDVQTCNPSNLNVNVNLNQTGQQDNTGRNMAAGAAGGCLGVALIYTLGYLAGPIIFLMIIMSMCS